MKLSNILLATAILMLGTADSHAATVGQHTFASQSQLAEGRWLKVSLGGEAEDGIYQISYDWLRAQGFVHPEQVAVYGYGGHVMPEAMSENVLDDVPEMAIMHDTERQRILFYGQGMVSWRYNSTTGFSHRQNTYDTKAYYFLHEKAEGDAPLSLEPLTDNSGAKATNVTQYDVLMLHELEEVNLGHTGKEKYGESFLNTRTRRFDFGPVAAGKVRVTTHFVAASQESTNVNVKLNGQDLGNGVLVKKPNGYAAATEAFIDKTVTLDAANGLSVTVTYTASSSMPTVARLDYIRIRASRDFEPTPSFETFRNAEATSKRLRYCMGDAARGAGMAVWDVTSPTQARLQQVSADGAFTPDANGLREYVLVNTLSKDFATVESEGEVPNQNLHALPMTDMVILTAPAYLQHAQTLAQYRRLHDNLHVTVVTPAEVYNEFSSGKQDVTAIRLLMKMFYDRYHSSEPDAEDRREPKYLLLWGDGLYDNTWINRDYELPCYETDYSLVETSSSVCDDYFGFLDDNEGGNVTTNQHYTINRDRLDIGIGRLPVSSLEQSANVLNKILRYSQNSDLGHWKTGICFLSDDDKEGDAKNAHVLHNEDMVRQLELIGHQEFAFHKIYLPAYKQTQGASGTDYPDAKREFQEALKQGVLMVNYAGHGNATAITNEDLMTATLASQLNMKHLPVWVTASCDVSRWDDSQLSMGECLLLNPNGGAIAMLSTVRVVYAQQNKALNRAMIDNIFKRFDDGTRFRLGDILRAAKLELGNDENKLNFCLLGDPSLTLAYPEQQVQITEINGQHVDSLQQLIALPALSGVTVKGRILKTGSTQETDSTFNGLAYPTFYDAPDTLRADKGYIQDEDYIVSFANRSKKAYTGRCEVTNGEFELQFTVPMDIAYLTANGLANIYACSEDGAEAAGFFDRYRLTSGSNYDITDHDGPEIHQLFMNSQDWRDGDVVNPTPYFFAEVHDESGFNTTGNTVGRDIVLTIRCTSNLLLATEQYTLNNYFTTYTGDPTTGNVQYSLPELSDGTYEATFRIWDVYNNPTTQKFSFTVQKQQMPEAVVVQAFPCPAKMGDTITFRVMHNRPESAQELTLQVFTQTGHKVYETTVSSNSAQKAYAFDMERPTLLNTALNADESPNFMGTATVTWDSSALRPGFYLYRVILSCNGSTELSRSELLMVNP